MKKMLLGVFFVSIVVCIGFIILNPTNSNPTNPNSNESTVAEITNTPTYYLYKAQPGEPGYEPGSLQQPFPDPIPVDKDGYAHLFEGEKFRSSFWPSKNEQVCRDSDGPNDGEPWSGPFNNLMRIFDQYVNVDLWYSIITDPLNIPTDPMVHYGFGAGIIGDKGHVIHLAACVDGMFLQVYNLEDVISND